MSGPSANLKPVLTVTAGRLIGSRTDLRFDLHRRHLLLVVSSVDKTVLAIATSVLV